MGTSFFGGDPNVSHFTVGIHEDKRAYNAAMDACGAEYTKNGKSAKWLKLCEQRTETHKAMRDAYRSQQQRLKDIGFKTPYFQYRNSDAEGKAKAKAKAEAFANEWSDKAGFALSIYEGCFL